MLPADRRQARADRYARHRERRRPLVARAAAIAREPVTRAIPVHRHNPAVQTCLGLVEIIAFLVLFVTGSVVALVVLVLAAIGFLAAYAVDIRAVVALDDEGRGALLAAGRAGRPSKVIAPAILDEPLPAAPGGLAAPLRLNGTTWWVDRSSFGALVAPGPDAPVGQDAELLAPKPPQTSPERPIRGEK
jgi:hypothetical protein